MTNPPIVTVVVAVVANIQVYAAEKLPTRLHLRRRQQPIPVVLAVKSCFQWKVQFSIAGKNSGCSLNARRPAVDKPGFWQRLAPQCIMDSGRRLLGATGGAGECRSHCCARHRPPHWKHFLYFIKRVLEAMSAWQRWRESRPGLYAPLTKLFQKKKKIRKKEKKNTRKKRWLQR